MMAAEVQATHGEIRLNEPMSKHVTWRAGGLADRYYIPADLDDFAPDDDFIRAWVSRTFEAAWEKPHAEVSVRVVETGRSRLVLAQEVRFATDVKELRQLVEAKVEIACVRIRSLKPVRIPDTIRAAFLGATAIQPTAGDIPAWNR